ncbi:phosphomethylpyrimidine kinase [Leadbetterella byssophila DSM 17132]|uniref:hydroxymethylpyrimidine kinase n=1 Tax=Leadbetterella byssophila (strain DSM 17132 / JCM 16389 / KACC 11308 / NBRC 106382 / 4M15) TaxID=649349 RepID=E4RW16_LEAB4|nr:bifunctional hydroxymethylpyrimidine kinase/phosphomethylpyrimidine kinase [Leadbetterella byssophila]ADQ16159.1 phosphomethylpyrimidine kinase [Leadbetterella byssophila DSM 17132]
MKKYYSVLSIAGFDGSGGAGIQADIKTISALGAYATTVLTALPVQNTTGVKSIHPIPEEVVANQLDCISEDIPPMAIKIGMVHTPALARVIGDWLKNNPKVPVVFDPVMVASSGDHLIEEETIESIKEHILPFATVLTPNMDEAAILAQKSVKTREEMHSAASYILNQYSFALLMKGGHLDTETLTSYLYLRPNQYVAYDFPKIETRNTHGSGCSLSSALATYLAFGETIENATKKAQDYVHQAILNGKDISTGKGHGPLNHLFNPQKMKIYELV